MRVTVKNNLPPGTITVTGAARKYGLSNVTISRLRTDGLIRTYRERSKHGERTLIYEADVEKAAGSYQPSSGGRGKRRQLAGAQ